MVHLTLWTSWQGALQTMCTMMPWKTLLILRLPQVSLSFTLRYAMMARSGKPSLHHARLHALFLKRHKLQLDILATGRSMLPASPVWNGCTLHGQCYVQGRLQHCRRALMRIAWHWRGHALRDWSSTAARPRSVPGMQGTTPAMHLAGSPPRPGRRASRLHSTATLHIMQVTA